jgi:arginase family enzyme
MQADETGYGKNAATLVLLDLDGSVRGQMERSTSTPPAITVPLGQWGPGIRIACSFARFRQFSNTVDSLLPRSQTGPQIVLFGSGDFHHVTLALLRRISEPFNLLLIDKHPDWVRGVPVMHCGTWLAHALRLPNLKRVFHVGGDRDFDNGYRHLAPWREIESGRITVVPAIRHFTRGRWRRIPHEALRVAHDEPATVERIEQVLAAQARALLEAPLYISIDKDVLRSSEVVTNWDAGHLTLEEVTSVIRTARSLAKERLIGADITGDWSPVQVTGILRRVLDRVEHEAQADDPAGADRLNAEANQNIVQACQNSGFLC